MNTFKVFGPSNPGWSFEMYSSTLNNYIVTFKTGQLRPIEEFTRKEARE